MVLLALPACGITRPPAVSTYVGQLTPTAPSPVCSPSKATLRIADAHVVFAPNDATWTLDGTATPDGTLTAERDTRGIDRKPYITELKARYDAARVSGTYTTPRCTFDVALTRL